MRPGRSSRVGPRRRACAARSTDSGDGCRTTSPVDPSTSTVSPSAMSSAPATATTHGMPSDRARIAVWAVGPPPAVTIAQDVRGVQPCGVGGGEIPRHQHERRSGVGDAGRPQAQQLRDDPVPHVLHVPRPVGEHPAQRPELFRDQLGRVPHGPRGRGPVLDDPPPGLVGERGVRSHRRGDGEDVCRLPGRRVGGAGQRVADPRRRLVDRGRRRRQVRPRSRRLGRRRRRGVGHARHDSCPTSWADPEPPQGQRGGDDRGRHRAEAVSLGRLDRPVRRRSVLGRRRRRVVVVLTARRPQAATS